MAYTTAALIAARINGNAGDPDVAAAAKDVDKVIDDWCGRRFEKFTGVREFAPGEGWRDPRFLETGDITAATLVETRADHTSPYEALSADLWQLGDPGRLWPAQGVWGLPGAPFWPLAPPPVKTVRITGTFGWLSVPEPVQRAAAYWGAALVQNASIPVRDLDGNVVDSGTDGWGFTAYAKRLLAPYRIIPVA